MTFFDAIFGQKQVFDIQKFCLQNLNSDGTEKFFMNLLVVV